MSDSKVFMFPDNMGCNGNNGGIDSSTLLALMNSNGGFGGNGNWIWIIFLFFLYPLMRGGNFFGGNGDCGCANSLGNMLNNDTGRQWLMEAVNGNRNAIDNLSSLLHTSNSNVISAINAVNSNIQNVGNQVGLSGQQVINAVQQGNMSIAQQLATCCCENKQLVTTMGYEGQLRDQANTSSIINRIGELAVGVQTGFASVGYETAQQTCSIQNSIKDQTQAIMDKLSNMEANAQQDKINDLTAKLTAANSRAEREAELKPILAELNAIRASQPSTVAVPYPQLTVTSGCNCGTQQTCCCGNNNGFWY